MTTAKQKRANRQNGKAPKRIPMDPTRLWTACERAVRNIKGACTGSSVSAGFITTKRFGEAQVFVRVVRFSEQLLRDNPETGGLMETL